MRLGRAVVVITVAVIAAFALDVWMASKGVPFGVRTLTCLALGLVVGTLGAEWIEG